MKVGSLFSGGGLGDFGFMAAGMDISWQCEIDPYCQKILALRYPESKKYMDIKALKGADLEPVDIITGGFPCQPFSVAGQQMGKSDDRHLWPEMFRIIQECKPAWVVGENVSGFIDMALDDVCLNLESAGYEVGTLVFPAHALGAWHRRERAWIIANAKSAGTRNYIGRLRGLSERCGTGKERVGLMGNAGLLGSQKHEVKAAGIEQSGQAVPDAADAGTQGVCQRQEPTAENISDADSKRSQRQRTERNTMEPIGLRSGKAGWFTDYWQFEPAVGRVANGIADRVHRLKMLGNGQVPACTYVIGKMIMDLHRPTQNQARGR